MIRTSSERALARTLLHADGAVTDAAMRWAQLGLLLRELGLDRERFRGKDRAGRTALIASALQGLTPAQRAELGALSHVERAAEQELARFPATAGATTATLVRANEGALSRDLDIGRERFRRADSKERDALVTEAARARGWSPDDVGELLDALHAEVAQFPTGRGG